MGRRQACDRSVQRLTKLHTIISTQERCSIAAARPELPEAAALVPAVAAVAAAVAVLAEAARGF